VRPRWQAATSWLRWHLPITKGQAALLVEQESAGAYQAAVKCIDELLALLICFRVVPEEAWGGGPAGSPRAEADRCVCEEARQAACGPECPGQVPVTQRDLDDAVAELIRDARREFGQGGAR
jgi:hypothetical protein